jgi:hypothetical protein
MPSHRELHDYALQDHLEAPVETAELAIKGFVPTEFKFDDAEGTVTAVFARFNVKDADGDVTLAGYFGKQHVAIADSHDRSKIVGRGTITEQLDVAVLTGRYFLETSKGKEAYLTTKAMGDLQEWSYGYRILEGGVRLGQDNGEDVRFLQPKADGTAGVDVHEVSTVLRGSGVGTGTTSIKSDGLRFVDQAEKVAQAAELLFTRAEEIKQMRAEKGSTLGDEALARLVVVKTRLENVATMLTDLTYEAPVVDNTPLFVLARRTLARSIEYSGG